MTRCITRTVLAVFAVALLCAPTAAYGVPAHRVERRVQTVTGAEIALDALAGVREIELGSAGATLTIDAHGAKRVVPVRLGSLLGPGSDPYAGVAMLAFAGSVVAKIAAVLSRLLG